MSADPVAPTAASGRAATDEDVHAAGFSKHDAVAIRIKLAAAGMRVVVLEEKTAAAALGSNGRTTAATKCFSA